MRGSVLGGVLVLAILTPGTVAWPADAMAAEALFREACQTFEREDHACACPVFAEGFRLERAQAL